MIFKYFLQRLGLLTIFLMLANTNSVALANSLDLNVNNDSVTGQLLTQPFERPEISLSAGFFYHQDDGQLLNLGFFLSDPVQNERDYRPWAKVGLKAVTFDSDRRNGDASGSAIAPGVMLTFFVPAMRDLYVDLIGFYAPEVLSYGDSSRYWDGAIRLTYQLMSTADVYVGYQHIEFTRENRRRSQDIVLDNNLNIGAVFRF